MNSYTCLSFDEKHHRFCLYQNEKGEVFFSYWREFKKHGISHLYSGDKFRATLTKDNSMPHSRGMKILEIRVEGDSLGLPKHVEYNQEINQIDFLQKVENSKEAASTIFINCTFNDIELHD